jgi:heme exporter protein A
MGFFGLASLMRLLASNLTCIRGGREVFRDTAFNLGAGEALLVTGRNGAGKSSLLRMVAGLLRPAGGQLQLEGGHSDLNIGEQAHYLGHQDALKPALSVLENLLFWSRYLGSPKTDPAVSLATMGLASLADLPAAYLSAGQRRRLSIARLLATPRPIWLLDEPTSSLDAPAQRQLGETMRQHLSAGGIILIAAHGSVGLDGARELRLGANP